MVGAGRVAEDPHRPLGGVVPAGTVQRHVPVAGLRQVQRAVGEEVHPPEALLLGLQLLGLVARLHQQLLRAQVALQHLQVQRRGGKQLLEQRPLARAERAEGGDLDHRQQRVARRERPGFRLRRRRLAQARGDAQVVRRQTRRGAPACLRARTGRPALRPARSTPGSAPPPPGRSGRSAAGASRRAPGRRRPPRRRPAPAPGPRAAALRTRRGVAAPCSVAGQRGHVGLDPALVLHGRGPAPQDVDRARQRPSLVRRAGERHRRAEVAARDGLHRALRARTGPTIFRKVSRPRPADRIRARASAMRLWRRASSSPADRGGAGAVGQALVVGDPIAQRIADARAQAGHAGAGQQARGLVAVAAVRQRHHLRRRGGPLAVRGPELVEQPAVPVVRHQRVGVRRSSWSSSSRRASKACRAFARPPRPAPAGGRAGPRASPRRRGRCSRARRGWGPGSRPRTGCATRSGASSRCVSTPSATSTRGAAPASSRMRRAMVMAVWPPEPVPPSRGYSPSVTFFCIASR